MSDPNQRNSRPQIFVSHSHADRDLAFRIVLKLTRKGFNVWWDDLLATGQQIESVFDIIKAADLTLVIWTKTSVKSEWVIDEAQTACQENRYLGLRYESGLELPEEFDGSKLLDLPLGADGSPDILPVNRAVLDRVGQEPREVGLIKAFDLLQKSSDEIVIWNAVRGSSHVNDYKVYLRRYAQNGKFSDAARKKVRELSTPVKRFTYAVSGVVFIFVAAAALTMFTLPYWAGAAPFLFKLPQDPEIADELVETYERISRLSTSLRRETRLKKELEAENQALGTRSETRIGELNGRVQALQEALGDVTLQEVAATGTYQTLRDRLAAAEGTIEEQAAVLEQQAAELERRAQTVALVQPDPAEKPEPPGEEAPPAEPAQRAETTPVTNLSPEPPAPRPRMISIEGGDFVIPRMQDTDVVDPERTVRLGDFKIAETEVSRRQWSRCIASGTCSADAFPDGYFAPSKADLPVTSVSSAQIKTFLDWLNSRRAAGSKPYRLPTESEWIVAARGGSPKSRTYPWGETFEEEFVRSNSGMQPVRFGEPVNGLYGMIDNAQERVADCWHPSCYQRLSVVRGAPLRGANAQTSRLTYRMRRALTGRYTFVGFRLAQ